MVKGIPSLRLVLIRHGESFNNTLSAISYEHYSKHRVADPELTPDGHKQAHHVASFLKDPGNTVFPRISKLYTSPMTRALQTSQPIGHFLKINPEIWPDIFETGGLYEGDKSNSTPNPGLSRSDIVRRFPNYHIPASVGEFGWYFASGRETEAELSTRVEGAARRIFELAFSTKTTSVPIEPLGLGIVSHGYFISHLIARLLGTPSAYSISSSDPSGSMGMPGAHNSPTTDGDHLAPIVLTNHFNCALTAMDFFPPSVSPDAAGSTTHQRILKTRGRVRIHCVNHTMHLPAHLIKPDH